MSFSLIEIWHHMGFAARLLTSVMAVMSALTVAITVERILAYMKETKQSRNFAVKMAKRLEEGDFEGVANTKLDSGIGYLGRVMVSGLQAFQNAPHGFADFTFESVARSLEKQSERELEHFKRGHGIISTVASTAPFVGLLATVMGIITSFKLMAASGSGGLSTISGGISEALVGTAFGLFVAIPAVFAANALTAWVNSRAVDLSESSNELLDLVAKELLVNKK